MLQLSVQTSPNLQQTFANPPPNDFHLKLVCQIFKTQPNQNVLLVHSATDMKDQNRSQRYVAASISVLFTKRFSIQYHCFTWFLEHSAALCRCCSSFCVRTKREGCCRRRGSRWCKADQSQDGRMGGRWGNCWSTDTTKSWRKGPN